MSHIIFSQEFYDLIYSTDMPMRIISEMRVGTVRQLARCCNLRRDTVMNVLKGKKRDDRVISMLFELYAKDYENYYGKKFTINALAKLY